MITATVNQLNSHSGICMNLHFGMCIVNFTLLAQLKDHLHTGATEPWHWEVYL